MPRDSSPAAALARLRKLGALLAHHFTADLPASCFSAALAVLAAKVGALTLFTKLSLLAVSNLALAPQPQVALGGAGPLVLYLSEARWQSRYREQAPLDRCQMAEDLAQIFAHRANNVAVDFDLSPGLDEQAPACRARLDALLDAHADALVLLAPFQVASDALVAVKADWMRARCHAGAAFADGGLNLSLGVVLDYPVELGGMGEVMHRRGAAQVCAALADAAGVERVLRRRDEAAAQEDDGAAAINFAAFERVAVALALEDPALAQLADWGGRPVYYGGDYGGAKDDRFLTPMGALPGVAVHAAIAWSHDHPVREPSHFLGVFIDVLTAFVFSLGIGFFWRRYLDYSMHPSPFQRELSTLAVCGFLVYFGLALGLSFLLAVALFAHGVLIAPLVIALSMLVDGFVRGPIEAQRERAGAAHAASAYASGSALTLLACVFAGALTVRALHGQGQGQVSAVAAAVLVALALERVLVRWRPLAPAPHAAHAADSPDLGMFAALALPSIVIFVGADLYWHADAGISASAFVGFSFALFGLLALGLGERIGAVGARLGTFSARRFAAPGATPRGLREVLGALAFGARQLAFWAVIASALFIMFDH